MIIMRITMTALIEKQKEMLQTLQSMIRPHSYDPGCLKVRVYRDLEKENELILMSEWKTRSALKKYMMSDRFSALLGTKSLLAKPMDMEILTVSHMEGMETMDALRHKPILERRRLI